MEARPGRRRVFLRDMVLSARIGIYAHEERATQRIRVNVELAVAEGEEGVGDDALARVVDYEAVAIGVRRIVGEGHVRLVETLAERIAVACLADARVLCSRVRVEKLDVFADAESAGVEVVRERPSISSTFGT